MVLNPSSFLSADYCDNVAWIVMVTLSLNFHHARIVVRFKPLPSFNIKKNEKALIQTIILYKNNGLTTANILDLTAILRTRKTSSLWHKFKIISEPSIEMSKRSMNPPLLPRKQVVRSSLHWIGVYLSVLLIEILMKFSSKWEYKTLYSGGGSF